MINIIRWVLMISILCAIGWMTDVSFEKIKAAKSIKENFATLPTFSLINPDSSSLLSSSLTEGSLVLIYFNSECNHCQYEARNIKRSIKSFSNTTIVFMSSEPLLKIKEFAGASGLSGHANVLFTKIISNHAFTTFGTLDVPHVFVYGPDKKLRKEFKGETKAESILKYLN